MIRQSTRRLAFAFGGALLALLLAPISAPAQDGQSETQGPVTDPKTDKLIPRPNTSTPPPQTTDELLPPVPASVQDPAPPGTNAVPVRPGPANAPRSGADARQRTAARPGVRAIEGVVIAIEKPEGDEGASSKVAAEKVRLIIDPSQDWSHFVTEGPTDIREDQSGPSRTAPRPEPADEANNQAQPEENKIAEAVAGAARAVREELADDDSRPDATEEAVADEADRPAAVPVLVTSRTRVYAHARTEDGVDLHDVATASSPATRPEGVGVTGRLPRQTGEQARPTNFTNIHVGSFVSIRYRKVSDANEAVNVDLIELPLVSPGEGGRVPGATPPTTPARPVPPAGAIPRDDNAAPVRVPAIPADPVAPGIPR